MDGGQRRQDAANGNGDAGGGDGGKKGSGKNKGYMVLAVSGTVLLLLLVLLHSCGERKPVPGGTERAYGKDHTGENRDEGIPMAGNNRLNLALPEDCRITDDAPDIYIGFPEDDGYDVKFTLQDKNGRGLYRTDYVSPGTGVAIDGTEFLKKGEQELECLVFVYDQRSGMLLSHCATVELHVSYE